MSKVRSQAYEIEEKEEFIGETKIESSTGGNTKIVYISLHWHLKLRYSGETKH
jgi:hypothetical protein